MIPFSIRRFTSWRRILPASWVLLLLALTAVAPANAQSPEVERQTPEADRRSPEVDGHSSEIDWRSTLILHFDPAARVTAADRDAPYLARIADDLESGWLAEAGTGAISVGPIFPPIQESTYDYSNVDPSLGTSADWIRLVSAARRGNFAVAVRLILPSSSGNYASLAAWAAETGVRHFILEGAAISDVVALRAALDAASSEDSWIAASSAAGEPTVSSDGTADDAPGHRIEAALFDVLIEAVPPHRLAEDSTLGTLYSTLARRNDESRRPLVASARGGTGPFIARVLMLPGALQMPAEVILASDLVRHIAAFRARHPAVARGEHVPLVNNAFTFARISNDALVEDRVIVVLGAEGATTINVSRIFSDNTLLQDALTGRTAFVSFGMATFEAGSNGVLLIEDAL